MAANTNVGAWPDQVTEEWTVQTLETLPDNGLRDSRWDADREPVADALHQRVVVRMVLLLNSACPDDHEAFVAPLSLTVVPAGLVRE